MKPNCEATPVRDTCITTAVARAAARGVAIAHGFRTVVQTMIGALVLGILAGCVGTTDQVVPTGHGTFMIPSQGLMGWSSGSAEKAKALEDAAAYCMRLGKEVETVLTSETEGGFGGLATPQIEFRCVPSGDGCRLAARSSGESPVRTKGPEVRATEYEQSTGKLLPARAAAGPPRAAWKESH
jgi:hypothetical protein